MKHTYRYCNLSTWVNSALALAVLATAFTACTKMDATYHDFWKKGEKIYPASPDSLRSYSGKNRIELTWLVIGDPSLTKAVIYWNNKTDSIEVPVKSKTNNGIDTINVMLKDMPEGNYSFDIYTYDEEGNRSVVANTTGHSYGNEYINSLLNRLVETAFYINDTATIVWGDPADETSIGIEMVYKDTNGVSQQAFIPPLADTTFISDFAFTTGSVVQYRTLYVPDSTSIDTFHTAYKKVKVLGPRTDLSKNGWSITASSYDSRGGRTDRLPEKAIDENTATAWVNLVGSTDFPHTITVDMGATVNDIYGLSFYFKSRNETPSSVSIYISNDSTTWQLMGLFTIQKETGWQYADFSQPESFRYFRVKAEDSYGSPNIVVYEAGVFTR